MDERKQAKDLVRTEAIEQSKEKAPRSVAPFVKYYFLSDLVQAQVLAVASPIPSSPDLSFELAKKTLTIQTRSMEEAQLLNLFAGCLDPNRIKASEEALNHIKRSPTFVQSLLTLLSKSIQDQQILIMAVSCYRKFLEEYYGNPKEPLPEATR